MKILDLFGAPGGFSLGFEMAGFESVGVIDIFREGIETYKFNFPNSTPILADIREVSVEEIKTALNIKEGELDVIIGGPPCQGFSTAGRAKIASLVREGKWTLSNSHPRFIDDPRNELYREFVRIVKGLKPSVIVMENVPGMMSYRNGEIVKEILEDFYEAGYDAEARVLNAVNYGVPQKRKRIIFIGVRRELNLKIIWPEPAHGENLKPLITTGEAISDLPDPIPANGRLADHPLDYEMPPLNDYQKWARTGSQKVHNHIARQHNERDRKTFSLMKEGGTWKELPDEVKRLYSYRDDIFKDRFRRLKSDEPSWTIMAHLAKDGYRYIHPIQPRTITVREAARLQSFPDKFIFKGSRTAQYRQVGNAVPPLLGKAIAEAVRRILK